MAAKPTKPDGLDVLLSWPQGSGGEPSAPRSRKARPVPPGGESRSDSSDTGRGPSPEEVLLHLSGRVDRLEAELSGRIDRLGAELRSEIAELVDRVDRLAASFADDTDRVLKGLEGIRRRLPVAARPGPRPPAEN